MNLMRRLKARLTGRRSRRTIEAIRRRRRAERVLAEQELSHPGG